MGGVAIATDRGIETIHNSRFLARELKHIRYLSRQLSRKQPRSQNRRKAKIRLAVCYAKVRNKREDFLHKLSTDLVKNHDLIVVEKLKIGDLLRTSFKSIARAISDAGWGKFLGLLKYKCEHQGKSLVEAGVYFPSTKQCSHCGKRNEITLAERWYRCPCGAFLHRDHNAALNL